MTERLNHNLNVDAIKTIKDVKNVFYTMDLVASMDEDNPKYEVAKEYFTIPYVPPELKFPTPRKSIEEIQQEFDEKIDKLIGTTKWNFAVSKERSEYHYDKKFSRIIQDFEYAREHGKFMPKVAIGTLSGSYLVSNGGGTGLSIGAGSYDTSFVIKQGNKHEGYYTFGNGRYIRYYMPTKPNMIARFFMKTCLALRWIDETN